MNYYGPVHDSVWLMPEVYDGKPIPELTRIGLAKYVLYGAPVGSFLNGLLTNDLRIAVGAADPENVLLLKEYVMWLNNNPSGSCWGSTERVTAWRGSGGMVGREWIVDPKYTGIEEADHQNGRRGKVKVDRR